MKIIKVSSKSRPNSVAGALANIIKDSMETEVQVDIVCIPSFTDIKIDNIDKTGIKILLKAL